MKYAIWIAGLASICTLGCADQPDKKISSNSDTVTTETPAKKSESDTKTEQPKQGNWNIDAAASTISFTIKNFGKDVPGNIAGLNGTIVFDKDKPEAAKFDAGVKVKTIDTDNKKRDDDLMADKYFNEVQHPDIRFVSKKVEKEGNAYVAVGDLIIKGVTHVIRMPFGFEEKENKGIFNSKFTINRHDYNIGGKGPIMGDDINVQLKVVANKN